MVLPLVAFLIELAGSVLQLQLVEVDTEVDEGGVFNSEREAIALASQELNEMTLHCVSFESEFEFGLKLEE